MFSPRTKSFQTHARLTGRTLTETGSAQSRGASSCTGWVFRPDAHRGPDATSAHAHTSSRSLHPSSGPAAREPMAWDRPENRSSSWVQAERAQVCACVCPALPVLPCPRRGGGNMPGRQLARPGGGAWGRSRGAAGTHPETHSFPGHTLDQTALPHHRGSPNPLTPHVGALRDRTLMGVIQVTCGHEGGVPVP